MHFTWSLMVLQSPWCSVTERLPHLTSFCADTTHGTWKHTIMDQPKHSKALTLVTSNVLEFFLLVWPMPALQHHSIKASSCAYLYYSSTHAFTLFFHSFSDNAVPCWYLVEDRLIGKSSGPWHEPTFGCVTAKEPVECHRHPKWVPHVVCIISFPNSWPTVQLETKFTGIHAASLCRSAETICTGAWAMQLPKESVKWNSSCKTSSKRVQNTQKTLTLSALPSYFLGFLPSLLPPVHWLYLAKVK